VFTDLWPEERELLYQAREGTRRPATCGTNSATNFGAEHVPDEDTLTHDAYPAHAARFDPYSGELILAGFDRWLRRGQLAATAPAPGARPFARVATRLVINANYSCRQK
jgi:hypothetical protein